MMVLIIIVALAVCFLAMHLMMNIGKLKKGEARPEAYEGATSSLVKELSQYGAVCRCNAIHSGEVNGMRYEYYDYLRIADADRDIDKARQNFNASVVKISGFPVSGGFIWTGDYKNYMPRIADNYQAAGRYKMEKVYAPYGEMPQNAGNEIDMIMRWWKSSPSDSEKCHSLFYCLNSHITIAAGSGMIEIICAEKIDDAVYPASDEETDRTIQSALRRLHSIVG